MGEWGHGARDGSPPGPTSPRSPGCWRSCCCTAGVGRREPHRAAASCRSPSRDRSLWDTSPITEGIGLLRAALAQDRLGEHQAQAAIPALHADAPRAEVTDRVQILKWYDELVRLTRSTAARLNRVVAAREAASTPERDHLTREAARLRAQLCRPMA